MRIFRLTRTLILGGLLAMSLTLNVATVAFSSVAMFMSNAYTVVTGAASVVGGLRRDVDKKTNRITAMSNDLNVKDRKIAALSKDVRAKNTQISNLRKEADKPRPPKTVSYRGKNVLLKDAVKDTTGRLSRRTATAAARSASSVFAEAIPFVGIAAILGLAALDLKESCDTMKDLQELTVAFDPDAALASETSQVCGQEVPRRQEVWQKVKSSPNEAWDKAKAYVPDLPEFTALRVPDLGMPDIDWKFWD